MSESDDEIGCVSIKKQILRKEEIREEKSLVSQVEKKISYCIIYSGCSHHMTRGMNKFSELNRYDGGVVRVRNNATCHIK